MKAKTALNKRKIHPPINSLSEIISRLSIERKEAEILTAFLLDKSRELIISHPEIELDQDFYKKIKNLALVHGGWNNPLDEYLVDPIPQYFECMPNLFFASGHTHKQILKPYGEKVYCNPGSVGQPRDGNNKAAFATFDGEKFELMRVGYDVNEVGQLMKQLGFSEYYYNRLKTGAENFGV